MITGMDISAWQGNINWAKAAKNGVRFAYIKVSQRLFADKLFFQNWPGAKAAGVLRGGYHYLVWDRDPLEQADTFCALLKDDPGELPPVADFEERNGIPGDALKRLMRFLNAVENQLGVKPAIYTGPDFWKNFGTPDPLWADFPLWIANYQVNQPNIPAPWKDFTFWQHTNSGDGAYYGCTSRGVDMNLCSDETFARLSTARTAEAPAATMQEKIDRLWRAHPALWPLP
jgi:lysozyme